MKNLIQALKELLEEKPGLWANINAKKKAGKKSSHKNSNAYKDAKKAGNALKQETKEAPAGHYFTKSGNLVKGRMSADAKERGARKSDPKDKQRSKVPKATQQAETANPQDGKAAPYGSGYKSIKEKKSFLQELVRDMIQVTEKKKGVDGKACWKGYRYAGTKNGKDICIKVKGRKYQKLNI